MKDGLPLLLLESLLLLVRLSSPAIWHDVASDTIRFKYRSSSLMVMSHPAVKSIEEMIKTLSGWLSTMCMIMQVPHVQFMSLPTQCVQVFEVNHGVQGALIKLLLVVLLGVNHTEGTDTESGSF